MPALLLFLWIVGFIGFYWLLRIVVDFACYSHRDWPAASSSLSDTFLLTSLLVFPSNSYLRVPLCHW